MSGEPFGPLLSSLAPTRGPAPCWVASICTSRSGRRGVGVGVLSPGVLTVDEAMALAMKIVELCNRVRSEEGIRT